ncbi:alpha/beta fold hydrolase [Streptomyces sp. NPDC007929]|uniref:alpha/beta fold hydrolase n=1 Tax=unclassified Streptomyces TaxID=2593676 RepID=UPI0036E62F64
MIALPGWLPITLLVTGLVTGIALATLAALRAQAVHFENALRLMVMIPSSRLYLINNCGHWAQMEHAEEFNRVVHEFISAH